MDHYFTSEDIRDIILRASEIKKNKCTTCRGTGWVNWNMYSGADVKPGSHFNEEDREEGECEECDGIGYNI